MHAKFHDKFKEFSEQLKECLQKLKDFWKKNSRFRQLRFGDRCGKTSKKKPAIALMTDAEKHFYVSSRTNERPEIYRFGYFPDIQISDYINKKVPYLAV